MKIKIYYTDVSPAPDFEERHGKMVGKDVEFENLNYRLVWAGSEQKLDLAWTDDEETLESVFNFLNRRKPEKFFDEAFRSMSIGDVICLEERCYLCQTIGWRRLENFEAKIDQSNK